MLLFLLIMSFIYVVCVNITETTLNYTNFKNYLYGKYFIQQAWRIIKPLEHKRIIEKIE